MRSWSGQPKVNGTCFRIIGRRSRGLLIEIVPLQKSLKIISTLQFVIVLSKIYFYRHYFASSVFNH